MRSGWNSQNCEYRFSSCGYFLTCSTCRWQIKFLSSALSHPHVVQFLGISLQPTFMYIVLKCVDGFNLDEIIFGGKIVSHDLSFCHNFNPTHNQAPVFWSTWFSSNYRCWQTRRKLQLRRKCAMGFDTCTKTLVFGSFIRTSSPAILW